MMKKVTVKQLMLLSLFVAMAWSASAQIKVGDNPNIINKGSILELEAKDKGVLYPRVALTASDTWLPLQGTAVAGMTVYNTATVTATTSVTTSLSPGFYFWEDAKWNKIATEGAVAEGAEWVYDPTTKQINLKRSGTAPLTNKVYYDEKGLLKNYTEETYDRWDRATKTYKTTNSATDLATNFLQRNSQSLSSSPISTAREKHLTGNLLIADETTNERWSLYGVNSSIITKKDNAANYHSLTGSGMGVLHQAKGNVRYLVGVSASSSLVNGAKSDGYLVGLRSQVNLFDNSTANDMAGIKTFSVDFGSGAINVLRGANHVLSFEANASSSIGSALGVSVIPIAHSNSSSKISDVKAFHYNPQWNAEPNTITVQNEYGLYLDNVAKGTQNNYAIFTKKGKVRFGDYMIAGKAVHNSSILNNSKANVLDQTTIVNNESASVYSSVASFYRLSPNNVVTEAPFINFAHQAPNENFPRRGGYIKSGLVFDNSNIPTGGYMEIQSCFGPASETNWVLQNASKTKLLINPLGGNVGIGTFTPQQKLHVVGNILASGTITPSDKRFKQKIAELTSGIATVAKLRSVSYQWNAKGKEQGGDDKEHLGFIAQELEKVLPNLVSTDNKGYKSVNYIEVIPVLTKAIQEQQEQIAAQQIENKQLRREVAELKALVNQLLKK